MRKKKPIIVIYNGKKVSIEFEDCSWLVEPLEGQILSQTDKYNIVKAVVNYG